MRRAQLRRRITHLRRINRRSRPRNNEVEHRVVGIRRNAIGISLDRDGVRHRLGLTGRKGSRHRETIRADHRSSQRSISTQAARNQISIIEQTTQIIEVRHLTRTVTGVRERERVLDVLTGNNIRTRHRIRRLHHSNLRRQNRMLRRHRRRSDLRTRRRLRSTGDLVVDQRATGNTIVDLHLIGQNNRLTGFQCTSPRERRTRQARSSTVDTVNSRLERTVHQRRVVENLRQIIGQHHRIKSRVTRVRTRHGVRDRLTSSNIGTRRRIGSLRDREPRNLHRMLGRHRRRSDLRTGRRLRSTGDLVIQNRSRGNAGIDLHLVCQNNRLTGREIRGPRQSAARKSRSSNRSTVDGRLQRARNDSSIVENRTQIIGDRRGSQGRPAGVGTGDGVRNGVAGLNRRTGNRISRLGQRETRHGMRRAEIGCRITCCGGSCSPRNQIVVQNFVAAVFDSDGVCDCPLAAGRQGAADLDLVGAVQCGGESAGCSTDRNCSVINDVGEVVRVVDRCRRSARILEIQSVGDRLADIDRLTGRW